MIEVSWGELGVLLGVGLFFIGRKDLPSASKTFGTRVGRVVGLLQGARARADRFTAQNELRQLQNELRSGLRELDAVKSELAVSMRVGRDLGTTVGAANRQPSPSLPQPPKTNTTSTSLHANDRPSQNLTTHVQPMSPTSTISYSRTQTVGAIAEEEWQRQGIAFKTRAETGTISPATLSGSSILAQTIQESLVHDQYDRVVREQDEQLQQKIDKIQNRKE